MSSSYLIRVLAVLVLSLGPFRLESGERLYEDQTLTGLYKQVALAKTPLNSTFWMPEIEGKTRFEFEIPTQGILNATKYQDVGALFYLSYAHEKGLRFSNSDMFSVLATPGSIGLDWYRSVLEHEGRYNVGLNHSDSSVRGSGTSVSVGYSQILKQDILIALRLEGYGKSTSKGSFGATFLNDAETIQYMGWAEHNIQNNKYYELGLESNVFEIWQDMDQSIKIFQSNEGLSVATALSKDSGPFTSSLGFEWSEPSSGLEIFVGFTFNHKAQNGNSIKLHAVNRSDRISPEWLDDLQPLRRGKLMVHWRDGLGFPRNK